MKFWALIILATSIMSIVAIASGAPIYRWELIAADWCLAAWACMAWFWETQAKRGRS
jgi:hypothetical protein